MKVPSSIIKKLESNSTFMISTHIQPDGDGIGSSLALMLSLNNMGKKACVVLSDDIVIPSNLSFLPGFSDILSPKDLDENVKYDCGIVLDAGTLDRIGNVSKYMVERTQEILNIDHHVTGSAFGSENWIESESSSTGEMIYELIEALGGKVDCDIATCIFTAICTDTGSFSYSNTTSKTFEIAGKLVSHGVRVDSINQEIYENRSYSSLAALSECILNMKFVAGYRGALIIVTRELMDRYRLAEEDVDDFITYARALNGVEVACCLREFSENRIRVGLRSKKIVDVAALALTYGGGGHVRAAGCVLNMPVSEAVEVISAAIDKAIMEASL